MPCLSSYHSGGRSPTPRCSPGRTPGHLPRPQVLGLRLTRLACGKLKRDLPAGIRENGSTVAGAAEQLPLAISGCCADPLRGRYAELEAVRRNRHRHKADNTW